MKKEDRRRPYPPALVSADTLAYLLDCSPSLIDQYVRLGHLPKPVKIGNLVRWHWVSVETVLIPVEPEPTIIEPVDAQESYRLRAEQYGRQKRAREKDQK
jgi:predicted DNA-binding transcriptional regulator AlpA